MRVQFLPGTPKKLLKQMLFQQFFTFLSRWGVLLDVADLGRDAHDRIVHGVRTFSSVSCFTRLCRCVLQTSLPISPRLAAVWRRISGSGSPSSNSRLLTQWSSPMFPSALIALIRTSFFLSVIKE